MNEYFKRFTFTKNKNNKKKEEMIEILNLLKDHNYRDLKH